LDYLFHRGEFETRSSENPAVLLLDLKLPQVDGLEVLQQIKSDEKLKLIPSLSSRHLMKKRTWLRATTWRERLCRQAR